MYSAIGLRPFIAAPTAQPPITNSEMGVLRTRLRAKFFQHPAGGTVGAAGAAGHLFPHQEHILVAAHLINHRLIDGIHHA